MQPERVLPSRVNSYRITAGPIALPRDDADKKWDNVYPVFAHS